MRIQEVKEHTPQFQWEYDIPSDEILESLDFNDQDAVVEAFNLRVCYNMEDVVACNESVYDADTINEGLTYKEVAQLIDPDFISHAIRAEELQGSFFKEVEGDLIMFEVPSSEYADNGIKYINAITFSEWDNVGNDTSLTTNEKSRLLLWASDISVGCSCPSFLYHAYNFICTEWDIAVWPETRPPNIKNPNQRGIICKHLNRTLRVLPFHSGNIAQALKNQFGE